MMKKILSVSILLGLLLSLLFTNAFVQANNDILIIPHPRYGDEYTVTTTQNIILGVNWYACRYGAVQNLITASQISWTLAEGDSLVRSGSDDGHYWGAIFQTPPGPGASPCMGRPPEYLWSSQWRYSLGYLEAGTYTFHIDWWLDHPVAEGADTDGDGAVDPPYEGPILDHTITINVTEP